MNSVDLAFTSALEQARLIRAQEISPLELTELYLERIDRLDRSIGSFVTVIQEQAIATAKAQTALLQQTPDPSILPTFFGVPISIKDLNQVQGVPCAYGVAALGQQGKHNVSQYDDAIVARIRQAGFNILGKTATSELGTLPYTEPVGFAPTRNPWNLNYTAAGSSGGAAAAVAAGLSPIAQGSDGAGSIRVPAAVCGLVGLKPSRGRVSHAPVGESLSGIVALGAIARTVADAAAFLDVTAGYLPGDPYWLPSPESSFLRSAFVGAAGQVEPLRIAFDMGLAPFGETDLESQQAVLQAVKLLESCGHECVPASPDCSGLVEPFTVVMRSAVSAAGLPAEILSPYCRWLLEQQDASGNYVRAVGAMHAIARRIVLFFQQYDALVLPVTLHQPMQVGEWADLSPAEILQKAGNWVTPAAPFNATGQPAMTIPMGLNHQGVPIGIQIVGRPADESQMIRLAAQLEAIGGWQGQRAMIP